MSMQIGRGVDQRPVEIEHHGIERYGHASVSRLAKHQRFGTYAATLAPESPAPENPAMPFVAASLSSPQP
jgi:hypothetical protein